MVEVTLYHFGHIRKNIFGLESQPVNRPILFEYLSQEFGSPKQCLLFFFSFSPSPTSLKVANHFQCYPQQCVCCWLLGNGRRKEQQKPFVYMGPFKVRNFLNFHMLSDGNVLFRLTSPLTMHSGKNAGSYYSNPSCTTQLCDLWQVT